MSAWGPQAAPKLCGREKHTAGAQSDPWRAPFSMTARPVYGRFPVSVPCNTECAEGNYLSL